MGLLTALDLLHDRLAWKWHKQPGAGRVFAVRHRELPHPLFLRRHTSDRYILESIFTERAYAGFNPAGEPKLIVDCGANIGCASVYFLSRFPNARAIAVEPDESNLEICRMNLKPFGERAKIVHAAIWPQDVQLELVKNHFECAHSVQEAAAGGAGLVRGISIGTLLKEFGRSEDGRIGILKIDIEGAEKPLFSGDCSAWLGRVDNLLIELHGSEASDIFFHAMQGFTFERALFGELTTCLNIRRQG